MKKSSIVLSTLGFALLIGMSGAWEVQDQRIRFQEAAYKLDLMEDQNTPNWAGFSAHKVEEIKKEIQNKKKIEKRMKETYYEIMLEALQLDIIYTIDRAQYANAVDVKEGKNDYAEFLNGYLQAVNNYLDRHVYERDDKMLMNEAELKHLEGLAEKLLERLRRQHCHF